MKEHFNVWSEGPWSVNHLTFTSPTKGFTAVHVHQLFSDFNNYDMYQYRYVKMLIQLFCLIKQKKLRGYFRLVMMKSSRILPSRLNLQANTALPNCLIYFIPACDAFNPDRLVKM